MSQGYSVPISHLQISQGHDGLGKAKIQMSDFKMVHLLQKNESQGHDGLGKPKFLNSDEKSSIKKNLIASNSKIHQELLNNLLKKNIE